MEKDKRFEFLKFVQELKNECDCLQQKWNDFKIPDIYHVQVKEFTQRVYAVDTLIYQLNSAIWDLRYLSLQIPLEKKGEKKND